MYEHMCKYVYVRTYTHIHIYACIYACTYALSHSLTLVCVCVCKRERERERARERERLWIMDYGIFWLGPTHSRCGNLRYHEKFQFIETCTGLDRISHALGITRESLLLRRNNAEDRLDTLSRPNMIGLTASIFMYAHS